MKRATLKAMGIVAALLSLLGCSQRSPLYSAEVDGRQLLMENVSRNVPFSDTYWPTLRWGSLPTIAIDSANTSHGAPYSLAIFRDAPVAAAGGATEAYRNTHNFESSVPVPVILYLDPARFSRSDFDTYGAFFEREWPRLQGGIRLNQGYREVVIVGLVHGKDADFVQRFERPGERGVIEVWTDGSIHLRTGSSLSSSNLSSKVQMPGERVLLGPVGGPLTFSLEDLGAYRDASGRAFSEVFEVVAQP